MQLPQAVVFLTSEVQFVVTADDVQWAGDVDSIAGPFFDLLNQIRCLVADYDSDEESFPVVPGFTLSENG